jgi:hypothetical protein
MDDTLYFTVGKEEREIKMTYGLLDEIARKAGDIDAIASISLDHDLRNTVLQSLLTKRDANGRPKGVVDIFTVEVSSDQVHTMLEWVETHLMDFFLTSLERTKKLAAGNEDRVKALMPTSNGGPA